MRKILLTFDVEEADIIRKFSQTETDTKKELELSYEGLLNITSLLDKHKIKATFFTTAFFAKKYPAAVREISKKGHEIACHGYFHSDNYVRKEELHKILNAKKEIEKVVGKKVRGFRAPRFEINNKVISKLSELGFAYSSSTHPTFISFRGRHLFKKTKPHRIGDIIEVPVSVMPFLRLPISWIAFKNTPKLYHRFFAKTNFIFSDYLMIVFHPWEFADLKEIKMPSYLKTPHGDEMLKSLEEFILFLKRKYLFDSISGYLKNE